MKQQEGNMKTFFNLVQEVQKPGYCHQCGGCVAFCTAINYGALELDGDGRPCYKDMGKCIECGICYDICPEVDLLSDEIKRQASWSAPMGRVIETTVARARDPEICRNATDGGAVTALLLHLLDMGRIDGAIVTKQAGPFNRKPCLATTREEIIQSSGFHFDTSHGMELFSNTYSAFSPSILQLGPMAKQGLRRIAFVGTPCQISTVRRMEALAIVPSDSIKFHLGLFCTGNFIFGNVQRKKLEETAGFKWEDVESINIKEDLIVVMKDNTIKTIELDKLDFMKRFACRYCDNYASEYADIAFGGIGAQQGWTTVITRTPLGRAVFSEASEESLEAFRHEDNPNFATEALNMVRTASAKKKKAARENRRKLGRKVEVKI